MPAGSKIQLAGIGLGIGDELRERRHRQSGRRNDHGGRRADDRNRLQSLEQIVGHVSLQRRVGHQAGVRQEDGVAIGRGAGGDIGTHHAAGARTVLGDDRLAEAFAQAQREIAAGGVDDAAGNVGQDDA
jgi:hypothetical protein